VDKTDANSNLGK